MAFKSVPRLRTFDYTGINRYFLTICSRGRARVFVDHDVVALILLQLTRTAEAEHVAILAYCFMPDHLHALIEGTRGDSDFREFVRVFKQRSSFAWKQRTGTTLWQRSFFDHVLREDEDMFGIARYILENPVRAGLVANPEDYPFAGSLTMTMRDLLLSVQIDQAPT